jgi:hypothetical protein
VHTIHFMTTLTSAFSSLLESAPSVIGSEEELDKLIETLLEDVPGASNPKQWDYLFRNAVLDLAVSADKCRCTQESINHLPGHRNDGGEG